jgi:hypothetical protein
MRREPSMLRELWQKCYHSLMLIDAVRFPRIFENLRQSLRAVSPDELLCGREMRHYQLLAAQRRVRRVHLPLAKMPQAVIRENDSRIVHSPLPNHVFSVCLLHLISYLGVRFAQLSMSNPCHLAGQGHASSVAHVKAPGPIFTCSYRHPTVVIQVHYSSGGTQER